MNPHDTVRIQQHGIHTVSLTRQGFELIADEPVFDDHQRPANVEPLRFRKVLEPNGRPTSKRERITFPAGLVGRVVRQLTAHSCRVRVDSRPVQVPTLRQPSEHTPDRVLRACEQPRSLFVVQTMAEKIRFIAQLRRCVPESHFLIVAQNNRQAREVAGMLAQATHREATHGTNQRFECPWLHVKSAGALAGDSAYQWDFVIFLNAALVLSTTSLGFLKPGRSTIRIGFVDSDVHQFHEVERGAIEAVFGPVDNQNIFAGGSIAWLQPAGNLSVSHSTAAERKRNQIWANDARNRLIARAAHALSENNSTDLETLGLSQFAIGPSGEDARELPTVAIVAANHQHGGELAQLLPNWRLEYSGYQRSVARPIRHDKFITTLTRAAEELLATTVIVYAAGGGDWLQHADIGIPWMEDETLIVDVADHYDAESLSEVRSRAAGYRRYGYHVVTSAIHTLARDTRKEG